jgi:hypothetical protein
MAKDSPQAPAGWYPDPSGGQRYWDGKKWLDIPEPTVHTAPSSHEATRTNTNLYLWIAGAVVAILIIFVTVVSANQSAQEQRVEEQQTAQEEQQRQAEAAAQAESDRILEERTSQVSEIVESVKVSAQELLDERYISGSIIDAYCNPVAGGSLSDINESTTVLNVLLPLKIMVTELKVVISGT